MAGTAVGKPKFLDPLVVAGLAPDGEPDGEELLEPEFDAPLVLVVVEVAVPLAEPPLLVVLVPVMTMVP